MRKNRVLFVCFLVIISVLFFLNHSEVQGGKVSFIIDKNSQKPFYKEIHGFNTNNISGDYAYSDKGFVDAATALKPAVLRFPGGTVANFYHRGKAGFIKSELVGSLGSRLNERNAKNFENLQEKRKGILSFDDFMVLCNRLDVKPVIVVNLYTGTPSESAEWVRHVKEKGYKVFGWELGNELYLPFFKNKIRDIDEYIAVAKKHAEAMKAADPQIRLAVAGHPGAFDLLNDKRVASSDKWNETLAREKFYSAYTAHMYVKVNDLFGEKPNIDDNLKTGLFEVADAMLARTVNAFRGRELWVTEWNLMFGGSRELSDTLLHALYCGDFFTNMVNTDIITNSEYHVFAGPWNGFPLISPSNLPDESIKRACYFSFDVLRDAMTQSGKRFALKVENNPVLKNSNKYTSNPVMGISAAAIGTQNKTFILISNRTSNASPADITLNNGKVQGKVKYLYVTADRLDARGEAGNIKVKTFSDTADKLVIPANSFGVIEIL